MSNISNQNQEPDSDLNKVIYQQLRNLAHSLMLKERNNHTLSPTDLVHEAFLKISDSEHSINNEKHYFRTLAKQMRMVLIDYGRSKQSHKNNAGKAAINYTDSLGLMDVTPDFSQLSAAIDELNQFDERSAEAIDLVYFANLPQIKAAKYLNIAIATLERDIKFGRAFINKYINEQ